MENEELRVERANVLEYNRELKEFCTELWEGYPPGQKKQWLKNPRIKALLDRFKIPYDKEKTK